MAVITVSTQAELDAALTDPEVTYSSHEIEIRSPRDVCLTVWGERSLDVRACGSSTVAAYDSSMVTAYDSSMVAAYDSSMVTAYDSVTVAAYDSVTVAAYDSSMVRACGSSTVAAYDSVTVAAYDSVTVAAYDSVTVAAYDSSMVRACGSSTVAAYDSVNVTAYDSSTVHGTPGTATHLHSDHATVTGGTILDHTTPTDATLTAWATANGTTVDGGRITLYKALPADLTSGGVYGHPTTWAVGEVVTCDAWDPDPERACGLHLGPTPGHALAYLHGPYLPRFLECTADAADVVVIDGWVARCKARAVTVVREVDIMGRPVDGGVR